MKRTKERRFVLVSLCAGIKLPQFGHAYYKIHHSVNTTDKDVRSLHAKDFGAIGAKL